jgi:hypothetical protein
MVTEALKPYGDRNLNLHFVSFSDISHEQNFRYSYLGEKPAGAALRDD